MMAFAVVGLPRHDLRLDLVRSRLGDDSSGLLLTGVSTTIRHVSIPCVLLSEDLLLRLKPVIKRTLTDASFVVLEGSCGDPFVEMCRHGRGVRTWFRSAGGSLARRLRCGRWLRFHGFPPMSSITNQIGDGKARPSVGGCQGEGTGCQESLLALFPPLPRRHRIRVLPQPFSSLSGVPL
jgi:hypothetical protein